MFENMPANPNATEPGLDRRLAREARNRAESGRVESEEIPFAETLPLGLAETEFIDKTLADASSEGYAYFSEVIHELTPTLFERALAEEKISEAYVQVVNAFKYGVDGHENMRARLLNLIDQLLAEPEDVVVKSYRDSLQKLKKELVEGTFSGMLTPTPSELVQVESLDHTELAAVVAAAQKEIIPQVFKSALLDGDMYWIEENLKKAKHLRLPEYEEMRQRALAFIDKEMDKSDADIKEDSRRRLERLKLELLEQTVIN